MTDLGNWLKNLPPLRLALGMMMMIFTAGVGLGTAGVRASRIPAIVAFQGEVIESIKLKAIRTDSLLVDLNLAVTRHIEQDSIMTARIYCVVERMHDGRPINPLNPCERQ